MASAVVGNLVNIVLCYALVLGELGFPQLGVLGAAISTVIGGTIEFIIPFALFLSPKLAREYGTRDDPRLSLARVRDLVRIGWPGGLMGGNEIVCWWIFMTGFVASSDTAESGAVNGAAGWAVLQYMHLSFMPAVGMSIAMTAIVGKYVGMGRLDIARKRMWQGMGLTAAYMGVCAVVFVAFREPMMMWFVSDQGAASGGFTAEQRRAVIELGATLLILAAAFQLFDAVAISLMGALRGAGDTVYPGVVTIVLSWTCIVGGGKLLIEVKPDWGSLGPWLAAAGFIIALSIALFSRFISGAWEGFAVAGRVRNDAAARAQARFDAEAEAVAPAG
jgi:MATE family multidrug resistance protein